MQTLFTFIPAVFLAVSIIISLVQVHSVLKGKKISSTYVSLNLLLTVSAALHTVIHSTAGLPLWPGTLTIQIVSAILLLDSLATTIWFMHRKPKINFDLTHDQFNESLTDEDLKLLSEVFHECKDANRGWKESLLKVMALEAKLTIGTSLRYEPDTTYNVKDKVYTPENFDLNKGLFRGFNELKISDKTKQALLKEIANLATQSQMDPENIIMLMAKNPECIFILQMTGNLDED